MFSRSAEREPQVRANGPRESYNNLKGAAPASLRTMGPLVAASGDAAELITGGDYLCDQNGPADEDDWLDDNC